MTQSSKTKLIDTIKEHKGMAIFTLVMAVYYGFRMFTLEPWYDELYTYYSFISRGPVYAAIHWPVPNNHVFYSVLSGCLMIFGNPYIALRGISWLFSVGNLILLYYLGNRFFSKMMSFSCVILYTSFYLVNYISIQGRGYTLAIGFYLIALIMLYKICIEKKIKVAYYAVFSLSLTGGLYAIPSNLYWVLPVCLGGGLYLLFQKEIRTLLKLVVSSLIGAFNTFCLYSLIWLAIGSNLLSKTADSGYFGIYQVDIILAAPFKAWKTGMEYMLASPYVQSIDRGTVISGFFGWLTGLMNLFFSSWGRVLAVFLIISAILCLVLGKRAWKKKQEEKLFMYTFLGSMLWGLPVILIIQSVQPYYRVFTFLGVTLTFLIMAYINEIVKKGWEKWICLVCVFLACIQLSSPYYNETYGAREVAIKEIWEKAQITDEPESICFMDDYQKYVLQFYWDYRPVEAPMEEAQYILMPKEIEEEGYEVNTWPILYNHAAVDWEYLKTCEIVEETRAYRLYKKKMGQ